MSKTTIVLNVYGGVVQDVFCSDPTLQVTLVDWDTQGGDASEPGIVEVTTGGDRTQLVYVADLSGNPLADLAGTDVECAVRAAQAAQDTPQT
jgi:hypothetical protein